MHATTPAGAGRRIDKLGVVVAALIALGLLLLPFAAVKANRIVPGVPRGVLEALPEATAPWVVGVLLAMAAMAVLQARPAVRLLAGLGALSLLLMALGGAAGYLTPEGDRLVRVAPAAGFWTLLFALGILMADALVKLKPGPPARIWLLLAVLALVGIIMGLGALEEVSTLVEYAVRADAFWREMGAHIGLVLGSLVPAIVIGVPLGILCARSPALRAASLGVLNVIQTIPSIALFGLLIAPLAWVAATVPGARSLGVAGIGAAPALLALFGYALLPIVATTVGGIAGVPAAVSEAARGMGMTGRQRLVSVELPLAFPVILSGIRFVLVQSIGIATVAALIGAGGMGVFVFQGIGQTAIDLVLLGAVPTVVLAFSAAIILDACADMVRRPGSPGAVR